MSYDLFFTSKASSPTLEEVKGYFENQEKYEVREDRAEYLSKDTGVYFAFDFYEPDDTEDDEEEDSVAFNMNYFRPSFFGLEAAPEIEKFLKQFEFGVSDPQNDGMGEGPFTKDGFLRGWNSGNRFAHSAILSNHRPEEIFTYPTKQLEAIWRWNFQRTQRMEEDEEEGLYIPRVEFFNEGNTATVTIWTDISSCKLPVTDFYIIVRDAFADSDDDDDYEICLTTREELAPLLEAYPRKEEQIPYLEVRHLFPSEELLEFITELPESPEALDRRLSYDQVLNQELVKEFLQSSES